jgi:hypothetical protein
MDTRTTISGGVCTKYADASSWTEHTLEADRCNNYVYSNGDIKWIDSSKLLEVTTHPALCSFFVRLQQKLYERHCETMACRWTGSQTAE